MAWIKRKVDLLYKRYKTRNPYVLAELLNIQVVYWNLPSEIKGFHQYEKRNRIIFINSNLTLEEQIVVCAHELAHALLHPRVNTQFMRSNTFQSVNKVEREANRFAAELLIPDEAIAESNNLYELASLYGVPAELVKLKLFYKEDLFSSK